MVDTANDAATPLGDFHYPAMAKTVATVDYTYDANGNMTSDGNKYISSVVYNYLNLPEVITVAGKGRISYSYDAAGNKLKKETVESTLTPARTTTVTGVQAKLPISLIDIKGEKKWRVLRPGGTYILKPPFEQYSFMPEVEDLTMHLARGFNIPTADHMLLETASGALAYLTRRFDRYEGQKIHAEDLCQLSELAAGDKYKSSYERVGKLINKHCTQPKLDIIKYFRLVLFCFLTGNNDMHLKNFSLMIDSKGVRLSPAYDLLNVNLVFPADKEELALTLAGRKKNINRSDFDRFALNVGLPNQIKDHVYEDFEFLKGQAQKWIAQSFLPETGKEQYLNIMDAKFAQLNL